MLSQELSDLLQLTLGWFTSATGSRYKASWERITGSGTLSPDLLPSKFHTARLSLSTAGSESVLTSGSSGSQSRTSLSDIISPFSLGSSLSKWIPPDTPQIPLFKMYLSFILLVMIILKKKISSPCIIRLKKLKANLRDVFLLTSQQGSIAWELARIHTPHLTLNEPYRKLQGTTTI